jgi:F0F1-type ATP synthase assembly protein I
MMDEEQGQQGGKSQGRVPSSSGAPSAATFAGLGLQLAASILLFLYLGRWLDTRLGTAPLLLVIGVFVGAAGGFYSLYRALTSAQRNASAGKKTEHRGGKQ